MCVCVSVYVCTHCVYVCVRTQSSHSNKGNCTWESHSPIWLHRHQLCANCSPRKSLQSSSEKASHIGFFEVKLLGVSSRQKEADPDHHKVGGLQHAQLFHAFDRSTCTESAWTGLRTIRSIKGITTGHARTSKKTHRRREKKNKNSVGLVDSCSVASQ